MSGCYPSSSMTSLALNNTASLSQQLAHPYPATDGHFIVLHSMTTLAAFDCIVNLLQLDCSQDSGFNICAHSLPPSIAPTLQQQLIPHK
jgi:hypothetical protein